MVLAVHLVRVFQAANLAQDPELRVTACVAALLLSAASLFHNPRHIGANKLLYFLLLKGLSPTRLFGGLWRWHGCGWLTVTRDPRLGARWLALAMDLRLVNFLALLCLITVLSFELLMGIKVRRCPLILLGYRLRHVRAITVVLRLGGSMLAEGMLLRELLLLLLLRILTILTLVLLLRLFLVEMHLLVGLWRVLVVSLVGAISCLLSSVAWVRHVLVAHLLLRVLEVLLLLIIVATKRRLLRWLLLLLLSTLIRLSFTYLHLNKAFGFKYQLMSSIKLKQI